MRADHTTHVPRYKSSGPMSVKKMLSLDVLPFKEGINENKHQGVLLLLSVRKTLAPCLLSSHSPLPAYNSCQLWNSRAAIKKRPGGVERPCGQSFLLLRPQLTPSWEEKVVLTEGGERERSGKKYLSSFHCIFTSSKTYPKSENWVFFHLCSGGNYKNLYSPLFFGAFESEQCHT